MLDDERIGFFERGLMAFVLRRMDDHRHTIESLHEASPLDGVKKIRRGMKLLEKYGYLERLKWREDDGTCQSVNVWHEGPQLGGAPTGTNSEPVAPKGTPDQEAKRALRSRGEPGAQKGTPAPGVPLAHVGKGTTLLTTLSKTAAVNDSCRQTERETDTPTDLPALETGVPVPPPSSPAGAGVGGGPLAGEPKKTRKAKDPVRQLKATLSPLELRRAWQANPTLRDLTLWQLADLFHEWRARKTTFKGDIRARRKSHPDEHDWQWFADEVGGIRDPYAGLRDRLPAQQTPAYVAQVDADQPPTLDTVPQDIGGRWRELAYEAMTGRTLTGDRYPSEAPDATIDRLAPDVPQSWPDLPLWLRALITGRYVVGKVLRDPPPTPKAPVVGSAVSRSDQVAASRAFSAQNSPQDLADKRAVEASIAARTQPAKAAPLTATPPAPRPAPVMPPPPPLLEPSFIEPMPDDIVDIFADPIPPAPSTPAA